MVLNFSVYSELKSSEIAKNREIGNAEPLSKTAGKTVTRKRSDELNGIMPAHRRIPDL